MAIDRGLIEQQLHALGEGSRWWDTRELRDLPAVLDADERILAISRGKIARIRWLRRAWLIVVTERRLLCLRSGPRTSWRQLEVSARQVERVSLRPGLFRARVVIQAADHSYRLLVPKGDAYKLEAALARLATSTEVVRPGFAPTRMVGRMLDHVLALPAVAMSPEPIKPPPAPKAKDAPPDDRIQSMEGELEQLRQQVDFLENLLRQRHPQQPPLERSARPARGQGTPRGDATERAPASAPGKAASAEDRSTPAERPAHDQRGEAGAARRPGDVSVDPA